MDCLGGVGGVGGSGEEAGVRHEQEEGRRQAGGATQGGGACLQLDSAADEHGQLVGGHPLEHALKVDRRLAHRLGEEHGRARVARVGTRGDPQLVADHREVRLAHHHARPASAGRAGLGRAIALADEHQRLVLLRYAARDDAEALHVEIDAHACLRAGSRPALSDRRARVLREQEHTEALSGGFRQAWAVGGDAAQMSTRGGCRAVVLPACQAVASGSTRDIAQTGPQSTFELGSPDS